MPHDTLSQLVPWYVYVSGFESWDPPTDLPGPVSPRERDAVRAGAAHREDHRDAPGAEGESARALESGWPQQEEDGAVPVLRRHDLHRPLEGSLRHRVTILVSIQFDLKMISHQIISSERVSNSGSSELNGSLICIHIKLMNGYF